MLPIALASRQRLSAWACLAVVCAWLIAPASAATYTLPPDGVNIVGQNRTVKAAHSDTLADIARRFGLGHEEIVRANPDVDRWLPGEGTTVFLPLRFILPDAPRQGVIVKSPEMRLYYYPRPRAGERPVLVTHPVSVGRMDWSTPTGKTRIVSKVRQPAWHPPASIRAEAEARGEPLPERIPPGPDNPLGDHALRLSLPGYLIHGTNRPYGVGMRVTHGCIRMYPEDIEALFAEIPVGTSVRFVNQPVKAAVLADTLFLEVHPALEELPMDQETVIEAGLAALDKAAGFHVPQLDRDHTLNVVRLANGAPEIVSRRVMP